MRMVFTLLVCAMIGFGCRSVGESIKPSGLAQHRVGQERRAEAAPKSQLKIIAPGIGMFEADDSELMPAFLDWLHSEVSPVANRRMKSELWLEPSGEFIVGMKTFTIDLENLAELRKEDLPSSGIWYGALSGSF